MQFTRILINGFLAAGCLILLMPTPAYADDYGVRLMAGLASGVDDILRFIGIGCGVSLAFVILVETGVILLISRVKLQRALLVSFLANAASSLCGLFWVLFDMQVANNRDYLGFWLIAVSSFCAIFTWLGWYFTESRAITITIACTLIFGAMPVFLLLERKIYFSSFIGAMLIIPFSLGVTLASEAGIFGTILPVETRNRALVITNICSYALYLIAVVIPLSASWIRL